MAAAPLSMIERPPIFTTFSQGSTRIGSRSSTGRVSSLSSSVWRASEDGTCLVVEVVLVIVVLLSPPR